MSDKVIIHPHENGNICVVFPLSNLPVEEIARKDVPQGLPFLILNKNDLPANGIFFEAWEADFSNPDGYGIGAEAWFAEQGAEQ